MLTPDAFKKCLIGSNKTDKYAKYFLLLEKIIKYYNQYQLILNKLERSKLSKKLDELLIKMDISNNKLDKQTIELNEIKNKNDELLNINKNQTTEINKLCNIVEDTNIKTEEIAEQLTTISHNQVPKLKDVKFTHDYLLLRDDENNIKFYSIRAQKKNIQTALDKKPNHTHCITIYLLP